MTRKTKLALGLAGLAAGAAARAAFLHSKERDIRGEVVLITGGSRGLGLAMARKFAAAGAKIAICARDEEELERARKDLSHRGAFVFAIRCDVSDRSEVEKMISEVTAHYGRIDILVNNAGEIQVGPIESATVEDFKRAMNTMFWGVVHPTLSLLPGFLARGKGQIVNITSIGGKVAVPHLLPYVTAKFAAEGFSEGLRAELKPLGIQVTTIAPGLMRTGSYTAARFKGNAEREANWFSLGASLPGISMDASRAARQIVHSVKRGDAENILTLSAALLAKFHGMFPGLSQDILGFVGSMVLPAAANTRKSKAPESKESSARPGWSLPNLRSPRMRALLFAGRLAARQLNQRLA